MIGPHLASPSAVPGTSTSTQTSSRTKMKVIEPVETMQLICKRLVCEARTIRLVPTMGSLHAGHASLIKHAIEDQLDEVDRDPTQQLNGLTEDDKSPRRPIIVLSLFVNPLQFNDRDDFDKYPIETETDLALCRRLDVDYVFMPKSEELVAVSGANALKRAPLTSENCTHSPDCVMLKPPNELAQDLEGESRPNHFEGMLTIVCKLFNIVQPSRAYFGEKDYQQLVLVDKMVRDLNMPIKICPVKTVREAITNLPLSSRNGRLTEGQRQAAASLMFVALLNGKQSIEDRCRRSIYDDSDSSAYDSKLESIILGSLLAAQTLSSITNNHEEAIDVDYFELRCAKDLSVIGFDRASNLYDCFKGCVRTKMSEANSNTVCHQDAEILEARLLISVLIAGVRLLDNMEVQMNS